MQSPASSAPPPDPDPSSMGAVRAKECRAAGPSCECALFREGDGRCLMLPHCPTRPEPLPARFPVGEDHYRVLKRRAFEGRKHPFFFFEEGLPGKEMGTLPVLEEPRMDAPHAGVPVKPGETLVCGETTRDPVDAVDFCHVGGSGNRTGWVPFRRRATGAPVLHPLLAPRWVHSPESGKGFHLLKEAEGVEPTGETLSVGQEVDVLEQLEGEDGTLWLRAADPAGWVPTRLPSGQRQMVEVDAEMWRVGSEGVPLLRKPVLGSDTTGSRLAPGQHFWIAERASAWAPPNATDGRPTHSKESGLEHLGPSFVRPRDESGWVPALGGTEPLQEQPYKWVLDPDSELALRDLSIATPIRLGPSLGAKEMGAVIWPEEVFGVIDETKDDAGNEWLRLADGRGWVAKTKEGRQISFPWPRNTLPYVVDAKGQCGIDLLSEPSPDATPLNKRLPAGEVFLANEQRVGADGRTYLKILGSTGWVSANMLRDSIEVATVKPLRLRQWYYAPPELTAAGGRLRRGDMLHFQLWSFELYEEPRFGSKLVGDRVFPGEKFLAIEEILGDDMVVFLRPVGKRGYVPVHHHRGGQLCHHLPSEMWYNIYIYIYIYTHTYTYIYIYMLCVYIYIYIYIY